MLWVSAVQVQRSYTRNPEQVGHVGEKMCHIPLSDRLIPIIPALINVHEQAAGTSNK